MYFTHAKRIDPPLAHQFQEPYDASLLRELEQQVDRGDATVELRDGPDDGWSYTHRLTTATGALWVVFDRETK